jgi:hypothetical protein
MIVASTHQDALPVGTQQRLADFTELVSTAIANAHAREELRTLADQQAALRRVATLVACTPPPEAVFAAVAEEVGWLLEADLTVLARYEADDTATVVGSWSSLGDAFAVGGRVPLGGHNTTALVFKTGRPARIDHQADEDASVVTAIARPGPNGVVGRCLISYPCSGEGWSAVWSRRSSMDDAGSPEVAVSAGCRRQMLYYRRNDDQERCHADRGEAGVA